MQLTATRRESAHRASRKLRPQGLVPAVIYGQGRAAQPVAIDAHALSRLLAHSGRTQLIDLVIDGGRAPRKVLIKDVQLSPRRNTPLHVDFHQVSLREKIQVDVPLNFVGEAPGVKAGLGDLMQLSHALRVECLPAAIPESLEVDVTSLEDLDSAIRIADLALPANVVVVGDPEELVAKIQPSRVAAEVEEEEVAAAAEEGAEVEATTEEGAEASSSEE